MEYFRNDSLYSSVLDDEICLFNSKIGKYHNLNKVGSLIWEILDKPKDIDSIVNFLIKKFEIDKKQCFLETENFLKIAVKEKIFLTRS